MSHAYTPLSAFEMRNYSAAPVLPGTSDLTDKFFELCSKSRNLSNVKSFNKQPTFLEYSQVIETDIKKAKVNISQLNDLTTKSSLFNTDENRIHTLSVGAKDSLDGVQNKLDYLLKEQRCQSEMNNPKFTKNVLDTLKLRFMNLTKDFNSTLQKRSKKLKQNEEKKTSWGTGPRAAAEVRQRKPVAAFLQRGGGGGAAVQDPYANNNGGGSDYSIDLEGTSGGFHETAQVQVDNEHLKKRSESLRSIEKMMHEVSGLFQRMATAVHMHDTLIDRIDKNTDDARDNVKKGKREISKYYKYVSSNRRTMITIFIFLVIFSAIYILLLA